MRASLEHLFASAKSFITLLEGQVLTQKSEISSHLVSPEAPEHALAALHKALQEAYPETGAPYWRVRSWGLMCWQPIYLALISVYQLQAIPMGLKDIEQSHKALMIGGYALPDRGWRTGERNTLITLISHQLNELFSHYRTTLIRLYGGRDVLYQNLLADQLISALVSMTHLVPDLTEEQIRHDYTQWAEALQLPLKPLERLQFQDQTQPLFIRQTCCLHFRRSDGDFCSNCPKSHTKKPKEEV